MNIISPLVKQLSTLIELFYSVVATRRYVKSRWHPRRLSKRKEVKLMLNDAYILCLMRDGCCVKCSKKNNKNKQSQSLGVVYNGRISWPTSTGHCVELKNGSYLWSWFKQNCDFYEYDACDLWHGRYAFEIKHVWLWSEYKEAEVTKRMK